MKKLVFPFLLIPLFAFSQSNYTIDRKQISTPVDIKPLNLEKLGVKTEETMSVRPVVQQGFTLTSLEGNFKPTYINQVGFSTSERFIVAFGADNVVRLYSPNGLLYSVMPGSAYSYDDVISFDFDKNEELIAYADKIEGGFGTKFIIHISTTNGESIKSQTYNDRNIRFKKLFFAEKENKLLLNVEVFKNNFWGDEYMDIEYEKPTKQNSLNSNGNPSTVSLQQAKEGNLVFNESFFRTIVEKKRIDSRYSSEWKVQYYVKSPKNNYVATIFNKDNVPLKLFKPDGTFLKSIGDVEPIPSIESFDISPNGNMIAVFYQNEQKVRLFDRFGFFIRAFKAGGSKIQFSPNNEMLGLGGGNSIILVDLYGNQKYSIKTEDVTDNIQSYCFTPDSKYIALSSKEDESFTIYNFQGKVVKKVKTDMRNSTSIAFSSDYKILTIANNELFKTFAITEKGDFTSMAIHRNENLSYYPLASDFRGLNSTIDEYLICKLIGKEGNPFDLKDGRFFAYHPNGKSFVLSTASSNLYLLGDKSNIVASLSGCPSQVIGIKYSPDGSYFVIASRDGGFRIMNPETNQYIVCTARGNYWVACNNKGYFDASSNGGGLIAMSKGFDVYPIDQFAAHFNRPDLVMKTIGAQNYELVDHYQKQYAKRIRRMDLSTDDSEIQSNPPTIEITDFKQNEKNYSITCKINDPESKILSYNIFVNDVPIFGAKGKPFNMQSGEFTESFELSKGKNKIEATCTNSKGVEAYRAITFANFDKPVKSNLYFLAFGVSKYNDPTLNLKYADKDANDLSKIIETYKDRGFENIYAKVLTNEQVTPEAIKMSKDFLQNGRVDDAFILFIAGHGMHDSDSEATYYYLTSNTDLKNLKGTAVNFETIEELLQGIPQRNKLFLMDACESGEIDDEDQDQMIAAATGAGIASRGFKNTSSQTTINEQRTTKRSYLYQKDRYIYNDLVRRSGAIVFSSSKGGELSYERSDIENGLFTEYIMKALTTAEADKNKDYSVGIKELQDYVAEQVAKSTGEMQHPVIDRDNIFIDIILPLGFTSTADVNSTFTDPRDGNKYTTTVIGNQIWMTQNLNYVIPKKSFCYSENESNCEKYGQLYKYVDAKEACPDGWHLPTENDVNELIRFTGIDPGVLNDYSASDAKKVPYKVLSEKGFLPESSFGGIYWSDWRFLGTDANFWIATPETEFPRYFRFTNNDKKIWFGYPNSDYKKIKSSVRCVKGSH